MMRWLLTAVLIFALASPVEAYDPLKNIPLMMKRIVAMTGLPMAPPPRAVREVDRSLIIRLTGNPDARAAYRVGFRTVLYVKGYSHLVPHELVHLFQVTAGLNPRTLNSERHAVRIEREYWDRWPS